MNQVTEQISATVHTLMPLWCDNVYKNQKYITDETNFAKLLCKTYPECHKLKKLQSICFSNDSYAPELVTCITELPEQIINNAYKYCVENFPTYTGTYVCDGCVHKISTNKPALIIAGGPSLEAHNHLKLLQEHGFNGDIFCVTSVLKKVLEHNIKPKYFCSLDSGKKDTDYLNYEIIQDTKNITGLLAITVLPDTNKVFKGKRYFFNPYIDNTYCPNLSYTFNLMTKCPTIGTGGNVGTNAIMLAYSLGYNPIIVIGLDLSFETYDDMVKYYENDHQPYWNTTSRKIEFDETKYKIMHNTTFNKKYYIDVVFNFYAESTISMIKTAKNFGRDIINCTEQGAIYDKEIINTSFKEYLTNQSIHEHK